MWNSAAEKKAGRHFSAGFTLLEVMVALSIMAIVLVAVYKMQSMTIAMVTSEKFYATAPFLAQGKMAVILAATAENAESGSGDFGDDYPGYTWQTAIEDVSSETLENAAESLKQIDVTVWFNGDAYRYVLRNYGYMPAE